jgi:hypothetical protein
MPIRQTLAPTPELLAAFSHSSAALRAHTIQNAGDHIRGRLDCAASHELRAHLTNNDYSAIRDPLPAHGKHREFWIAVGAEAKSQAAECISSSKVPELEWRLTRRFP